MLNIKNPCSENWENMKIGLNSRFCDNCKKNVIDFTDKSRVEILEYLISKKSERVCGKVYQSQLDFSNTDLYVTIQYLSKNNKNSNIPFYLLTIGTMLLMSCNSNITEKQKPEIEVVEKGSVITNKLKKNSLEKPTNNKDRSINELVFLGDIIVDSLENAKIVDKEPFRIVDEMPEFKGGFENLKIYLNKNCIYPKWELDNKIEGKVFVTFIVDKKGKIKNAKILRSVIGSKNFDKEVLRIINKMPDWKPGIHKNNFVDVEYRLPISFKL